MLNGNKCFHWPSTGRDAPVLDREVGSLRAGRGHPGGPQRSLEVSVAGTGLGRLDPAGGLVAPGRDARPRREMRRGGKHVHLAAGFGEQYFSDDPGDARDAAQQFPGRRERCYRLIAPGIQISQCLPVPVNSVRCILIRYP